MPAISVLLGRPQRMLLIEVGLTITFIVIAGITTAGGFITELIRLAAARSRPAVPRESDRPAERLERAVGLGERGHHYLPLVGGRDLCLENSAHEFGSNGQVWFASFSETTDVILAVVDRTARSANSFEPRPLGGPSEGVFSQEPGSSPDLDGLDIVFTATAGEGDAPF